MTSLKIGSRSVAITHPDKIIFPADGITKQEFVVYYQKIAPRMLPLIKNRLITMHRFVENIHKEGFYQKDAGSYFPSWIKRAAVAKESGGVVHYVVCANQETIVYLANQLCITPHAWLSTYPKINYPDRLIFDLDPAGKAPLTLVQWAAAQLKQLLGDQLELPVFIMTTGSRGYHVVVPLKPVHTFDEVRAFAQDCAAYLVQQYPNKLTLEMRKNKRGNKIFLDTLRNSFGATGVAPYAVRAKDGAPIAMPISWKDLLEKKIKPQHYKITNVFRLLKNRKDPWKGIEKKGVRLAAAIKKLKRL